MGHQSIERLKQITDILSILPTINESNFEDVALQVFKFQYKNNLLYQSYVNFLGKDASQINDVRGIPFLPIRFFKSHEVKTGIWQPEIIFTSSATTGVTPSQHAVASLEFYLKTATAAFEQAYGPLHEYHFLALLPSYLERRGSSLIAMIDHFVRADASGQSGYYLRNHAELVHAILKLKRSPKRTILWGVSFALLDLAEEMDIDLSHCIIIETGGMKGRRKEWVREELHDYLCRRFHVKEIHSEYGMTELLSQAYSPGRGYFQCVPWMKVLIRELNDPMQTVSGDRIGGINVVDLANFNSCSFVETEDLGRVGQSGYFEVLGRADNSEVRGCNLLITG